MSSLFEITNDLQMLYEMATDPECDPRELDDTIEGTLGALEIKAGGYANVIKTLEMEQDQAKKIAQEFTRKATVRENSIKRMKAALNGAAWYYRTSCRGFYIQGAEEWWQGTTCH